MKVAVFGVGSFGQHHARIVNDLDDVKLAGIIEPDVERGGEIASRYGVKRYDSFEQLETDIDAAIIITPTSLHAETALKCLENNIHAFVEKPITSTSEEAEKILSVAEKNNLILQVGHVERFNPAFLAVKDTIKNPRYLEARRISPFPERIKDADVVADMMIHDIDIVLSLMKSPVTDIRAIGMKVLTDKADMAQVRLEFENGGVANLSSSRVSDNKFRKLRVFEADRYVSIDFLSRSTYWAKTTEVDGRKKVDVHEQEVFYTEPLQMELLNFFNAVRGHESIGVSGREAYEALKLAEEIVKKIRY